MDIQEGPAYSLSITPKMYGCYMLLKGCSVIKSVCFGNDYSSGSMTTVILLLACKNLAIKADNVSGV